MASDKINFQFDLAGSNCKGTWCWMKIYSEIIVLSKWFASILYIGVVLRLQKINSPIKNATKRKYFGNGILSLILGMCVAYKELYYRHHWVLLPENRLFGSLIVYHPYWDNYKYDEHCRCKLFSAFVLPCSKEYT